MFDSRDQVLNRMLEWYIAWINERSQWQITLIDIEQIKKNWEEEWAVNFRTHLKWFGSLCAMDAHRNIDTIKWYVSLSEANSNKMLWLLLVVANNDNTYTLNYVNGLNILFSLVFFLLLLLLCLSFVDPYIFFSSTR